MTAGTSGTSVTVVVVTLAGPAPDRACLESLSAQTLPHRLVVVDNASTDGTAAFLAAEHPEATVVTTPENLGFAGGVQAGLDVVETPYAALLNNDAEAEPGWLEALVGHLEAHPEAAAVTSRMVLADRPGVLNNTGVVLLPNGYGTDRGFGEPEGAYAGPEEVFGFSGGAAALRMSAVREVGGFAAPVLPLLRGHRPLVAAAAGRLDRPLRAPRGGPAPALGHRRPAVGVLRLPQRAQPAAHAAALRPGRGRGARRGAASCSPRRRWPRAGADRPATSPTSPRSGRGVRLRAFGSFLRLAPWALRERRSIVARRRGCRRGRSAPAGRRQPAEPAQPAAAPGGRRRPRAAWPRPGRRARCPRRAGPQSQQLRSAGPRTRSGARRGAAQKATSGAATASQLRSPARSRAAAPTVARRCRVVEQAGERGARSRRRRSAATGIPAPRAPIRSPSSSPPVVTTGRPHHR